MAADEKDYNDNRYSQWGEIDRFEEKTAVILLADGQSLRWPIGNLPADAAAGQKIRLVLATSQSAQEEKESIAKTMINEILKNSD